MNQRAFTLIEVMIVTIMIAVISVGVSLSFGGIRKSTAFNEHQTRVVEVIQKARGLSLSHRVHNNEPIDHYKLGLYRYKAILTSDGPGGVELIDEFKFDTTVWDIEIDVPIDVYYFPPYGDICFTPNCDGTDPTSKTINLYSTSDPNYITEITIDVYGGFPEIDENP